jgi:hypothetical protein
MKDNVKKHLTEIGCVGLNPIHWTAVNGYLLLMSVMKLHVF